MKRETHGVISLLFIYGAIIIGLVCIFNESPKMGIAYIILSFISSVTITYSFCSKCECRSHGCGHVFPGKIAGLLPPREEGLYTFPDIGGVIISLMLFLGFPQYWLWGHHVLLIAFWVLIITGLIEIRRYVCPGCSNEKCPICTGTSESNNKD